MDTASQVLWKSDFSFECYKLNCKPPNIDYPVSTHPLNQIHIYITIKKIACIENCNL